MIQHLQLDEYTLIGHSMGGTVSALLAALHSPSSKDCCSLMALDLNQRHLSAPVRAINSIFISRQFPRGAPPNEIASDCCRKISQVESVFVASKCPDTGRSCCCPPQKTVFLAMGPPTSRKVGHLFSAQRHQKILGAIECPTHLIFGKTSWYRSLTDLDERVAAIGAPCQTHWLEKWSLSAS